MAAETSTRDHELRGLYGMDERDLGTLRVLKVKLPLRQHIQLHSMRVLQGEGISATVGEALRLYFEQRREAELAQGPGDPALRP